ncbi:MAG: choice-of-anchor Q domain-containing protein, partial [Planctomycetaceae bacterium]
MSRNRTRRYVARKNGMFRPKRLGAFVSFEALEDRTMLSAVTVDNDLDIVNGTTTSIAALIASDGGDGISLREAIIAANNDGGADTIDFDASLAGGTITLGGTQLTITDDLTITGLGADQLTIDANNASRIFTVDDGTGADIDVEITGLTLTGGNGSGDHGGAIANTENLTVANSTIFGNSANSAGGSGGGIGNDGTLIVINSTISGNSADFGGGGIGNDGALTVTNSTISGNSAYAGGGIGNDSYGTLTLANTTISGNSADYAGGIANNGIVTVVNSTISGNSADSGGGGIGNYGTLTVANSTITSNSAYSGGGGIFNTVGMTTTVANSLISGNSVVFGGREVSNAGTFNADANNLFGHSGMTNAQAFYSFTSGVNDITATSDGTDPTALGSILNPTLANNGGPTLTHALVVGSPAINAGDNANLPADVLDLDGDLNVAEALPVDQRGLPFVRAFGGTVDIGAYEVQPRTLVVDTLVDESDGDFSTGDLSLREAIEWANANAGADTITFDAGLSGGTITLGGTELAITDAVTINGLGADQLTIDADGLSRIFNVDDDTGTEIDVEIVALTLTGGNAGAEDVGG